MDRALYLQQMNDPTAALSHYERAVRYATPQSNIVAARAWLGVSHSKEALGDRQGSYEASLESLRLDNAVPTAQYTHSAHAAQIGRNEEALKTLELAITAVPAYWVVAEHDDRFVPLGDAVPALLSRLQDEALSMLRDSHSQVARLDQSISVWTIPPASLGSQYTMLRSPLDNVATKLAAEHIPIRY